jgi:hypothetical protein
MGEAIPRGECRTCDPRRSHATTGASVRLACVGQPHPYSPRRRAPRGHELRPFSRLAEAGRGRAVPPRRVFTGRQIRQECRAQTLNGRRPSEPGNLDLLPTFQRRLMRADPHHRPVDRRLGVRHGRLATEARLADLTQREVKVVAYRTGVYTCYE